MKQRKYHGDYDEMMKTTMMMGKKVYLVPGLVLLFLVSTAMHRSL